MFRYVTQEEATKEKERRDALKAAGKNPNAKPEKAIPPAFPTPAKPDDKAEASKPQGAK